MSGELHAGTGLLQRAGIAFSCFGAGQMTGNLLMVQLLPITEHRMRMDSQSRNCGALRLEDLFRLGVARRACYGLPCMGSGGEELELTSAQHEAEKATTHGS